MDKYYRSKKISQLYRTALIKGAVSEEDAVKSLRRLLLVLKQELGNLRSGEFAVLSKGVQPFSAGHLLIAIISLGNQPRLEITF
jgi:hypothetical protein